MEDENIQNKKESREAILLSLKRIVQQRLKERTTLQNARKVT